MWGKSGLHIMKANKMEADASTKLKGQRWKDKDPCSATFVSKDEIAEEVDLYVDEWLEGLCMPDTCRCVQICWLLVNMRSLPTHTCRGHGCLRSCLPVLVCCVR